MKTVLSTFFGAALVLSCTSDSEPAPAGTAALAAGEQALGQLVVYSGRSRLLVEPLLQRWAVREGVELRVRYEKSTEALANRLLREGARSEADLFFAQSAGYLALLGERGMLAELEVAETAKVGSHARSPKDLWVATSGRMRVLVYSPERVPTERLPKSLKELADGRFKGRIGWAPGNASLHAHVSALIELWGGDETRRWLQAMKAQQPVVYPKNSPQVLAVSQAEIDVGWVNHYYLHKLRAKDPGLKAANAGFIAGDAGNLLMLAGVGIPKNSRRKVLARKLVTFLLSREAQDYFAQTGYEYPVVPGVPTHSDVPPLGAGQAAVPQAALTDLSAALEMLRSLGLH
jgi:iron(III) transport system substrate-binding protein